MRSRLGKVLGAPIARARRAIRRRREPHGLILGYHRVASDRIDPWQLCVSPQHFAQQLEALQALADVVPLRQLNDRLTAGKGNRPSVAITFDDGYADNLRAALPLLERFDAPATIFVCTAATGRKSFWWDRLSSILFGLEDLSGLEIEEIGFRWTGGTTRRDRESCHLVLWRILRDTEDSRRDAILERLERRVEAPAGDLPGARPMTVDEVRALAESPLIEIGAHSLSHRPLPGLPESEQLEEIEGSASDCERLTGVRPASFAYPFGDTSPATARLARRAGFDRACSQRPGLVWRDTDPYDLPRIGVLDQDAATFMRRLRREWLP